MFYKQRSLDDSGFYVHQMSLGDDAWVFRGEVTSRFIERLKKQNVSPLSELTSGISEGIVTGQNGVFLLNRVEAEGMGLETEIIRPCLRGRQVRRYWLDEASEAVIYPYKLLKSKTRAIDEDKLKEFPNIWSYLNARRKDLGGRPYFEASSKAWYELWCQRDLRQLESPKIVVPELSESNRFALANTSQFYGDTVCGITLLPETKEELLYLLGILNSKLIEFYYKQTTVPKANQFYIYKTMFLKNIPIRRILFTNPTDKARHDRMVEMVEQMLTLHKQLATARTDQERTMIQRRIDTTDARIDALVYELYGLTEEEIKIVEEAATS